MIRAVIFDLDNTLYDYDSLNEEAIRNAGTWLCNRTDISYETFSETFLEARRRTKALMRACASQHNRIIYFQKMLELLDFNPVTYSIELYDKYWGYILDHMKPVPYVTKLIQKLSEENIKIAICTDLTTHIQHQKLRKLNIANFVDVFVSSEEADAEKPDIKIFNLTLDKLKVAGNEVIHIGDSYNRDVKGADHAGIFPVWYNPHKKKADGYPIKKMLEIDRMIQLERYIFNEQSN